MAKEIERKFLVAGDAWRDLAVRSRELTQGYIAQSERTSVRVRVGGDEAWLNIKCGGLEAVRDEYEYALPLGDARELLALAARRPIVEKTRYWVPYGGFTWEIDEFHGANEGLVVAEIELDEEGRTFPIPQWIGAEVTHLPRYYNVNLVRYPFAQWTDEERRP